MYNLRTTRTIASIILFLTFLINTPLLSKDRIINGFKKPVYGNIYVENEFRMQPDSCLITRCLDSIDFIEWQTESVPDNYSEQNVTFAWIGGYSASKKPEPCGFTLYAENKPVFKFETASRTDDNNWSINNEYGTLSFEKIKVLHYTASRDIWGYFLLTIPKSSLPEGKFLKLMIKGDASGSRHWYRVVQQALVPVITFTAEKMVSKTETGELIQRILISADYYGERSKINIYLEDEKVLSTDINFGNNLFYINTSAVNSPEIKNVKVEINGSQEICKVNFTPVKPVTFYLIPEAHVDIGYTELQHECEKQHWKNFDQAIKLSEKTAGYPEESVFKWNVEVLWAVKSYLETFPEKREKFLNAVKKGWMNLDATYANILTGLCRPEELYKITDYSNKLENETGIKIESAMISDVPGYTWGMVNVLADNGIKYFSVGPNASDRIGGTSKVWGDKPFYWLSPSGDKKVLVWVAKKGYSWFHKWRLPDEDTMPIKKYLDELSNADYPYDMVHVRYNIGGDNGYPDSLLSDYVKKWNEQHETPKFVISSTERMFKDFENKYADVVPSFKGDFTPYWEDGAGSTAKETSLNRKTAELLNQLEILYSITGKTFPVKDFETAWDNVLLYSEHTWGAHNSISQPELDFVKGQWKNKQAFALKADSIAHKLYSDLAFNNTGVNNTVTGFTVYNTSSWERNDAVIIPATVKTTSDFIVDDTGKEIAAQRLTDGSLVFISSSVPALGSRNYTFIKSGSIKPEPVDKQDLSLTGKSSKINIDDKTGTFKLVNGNLTYDSLNGFIHTGRNAENPQSNGPVKIVKKESGPVLTSMLVKTSAPGCSSLTREITVYHDLDKIEIVNTIHKEKVYEKENLRFAFPFNIKDPVTKIDLAWSVIEPEKDQLNGANKNYYTVQRWIDVSGKDEGITLAPVDAPFAEIGGMNAERWMDTDALDNWAENTSSSSLIYSWVMNNSWHTNYKASQEGVTSFKYVLKPHGNFDYSDTYRFGTEQSQPLILSYDKVETNKILLPGDSTAIVLTSLSPSSDGKSYIARLYNPTNGKATSSLTPGTGYKYYLSNGDEENISEIGDKIEIDPFEVRIIKIIKQ